MIEIRTARLEDAYAIAVVHVAVYHSAYRGLMPDEVLAKLSIERRQAMWADTLTSLSATHPVLVAEDAGVGMCGFGNIGPLHGDGAPGYTGEFKTLYLLPTHQRRGLGREMLRRLAALLIERRHDGAVARVIAASPACRFYAAMGGVRLAQRTEDTGYGQTREVAYYGWSDLHAIAREP